MKRTMSLMQEYRYILSSLLGLKKKVEKLEEGDADQENIIRVPSATYSELGLTPESTIEEKQSAIATFLEGYENQGTDVLFFEIKEDPLPINFDVTSTNWVGISEADFVTVLENYRIEEIIISNFTNTEGRIQCNLSTSSSSIDLSSLNITQVNIISIEGQDALTLTGNQITEFNPTTLATGLKFLNLSYNQITTFNPTTLPVGLRTLVLTGNQITEFNPIELPTELQNLYLDVNQIITFNPTALPIGLKLLNLRNNQITEFNPTTLPTGLETLSLSGNQIITFNPTALPTGLQNLNLDYNQIINFNPTTILPTGLQSLDLTANQITTFNPTVLSTGLQSLNLSYNQITDWAPYEPWANSLPNGDATIYLTENPTSSEGTNFKSILQSKGYTVYS